MILEWFLSPITDKNTFTGGVINNYCEIKEDRRQRAEIANDISMRLYRRKVEALEKIADSLDKK